MAYSQGNRLILVARNVDRLNAVAEVVRENGAEVVTASIDATDSEKMKTFIQQQDATHPVRIV